MIDCTTIDLDADTLARVLMLARRHTLPLPLLVTTKQRKSIAADEVDGAAYVGPVPLWVQGEPQPPPRPAPVVVTEPIKVVDAGTLSFMLATYGGNK